MLQISSWGRRLCVGVVAVILLATARPAAAQGTAGMVPDPVTTDELMRYADRLGLSEQQRFAVESIHDDYKRRFRTLRDGDIETFIQLAQSLEGSGGMPSRKAYDEVIKKFDTVLAKIKTLDKSLFDGILSVLTESQYADLPRARMARERKRLMDQSQQMFGMGNQWLDLSEMVIDADLDTGEHAAAMAGLDRYERALTARYREAWDLSRSMIDTFVNAYAEMQLAGTSPDDHEAMQQMQEAMMGIMLEAEAKQRESANKLLDLNDSTIAQLETLVGAEAYTAIRRTYHIQAYPEASFALPPKPDYYERALRDATLDDETRAALREARVAYLDGYERLHKSVIEELRSYRSTQSNFTYDEASMQAYQDDLMKATSKASELNNRALDQLAAILGEERAAPVIADTNTEAAGSWDYSYAMPTAVAAAQAELAVAEAAAAEAAAAAEPSIVQWSGDQYLPPAMGRRDVALLVRELELDETDRVLVDQLHADYLDRYGEVHADKIAKVTESAGALWARDENGALTATDRVIEPLSRKRIAALGAINQVDGSFFDDIAATVATSAPSERLERFRLIRECDAWSAGAQTHMWGMGGEGTLNVAKLLRSLDAEPAAFDPANDAILGYLHDARALAEQRYRKALDLQQANDKWMLEFQRRQAAGEDIAWGGVEYEKMMLSHQNAHAKANASMTDLNRNGRDAVAAALSENLGRALGRAYEREAWPDIFSDGMELHGHLDRANDLDDLTADQRRQLGELAIDYHAAYRDFCNDMIGKSEEFTRPGAAADSADWQRWQRRNQELERIRFDRNELNARTSRRIRSILSEDQIKAIGGLPGVE